MVSSLIRYSWIMVRPERRRVVLAGESPDRVSVGAPGSRLPAEGEIRPTEAECRKPLKERGANQRAATISERNSLVKLSAERCLGGPSRSCHGEGNRQHPGPKRMLDLLGVPGGGTLGKSNTEQERPSLAARSGKDRGYKAGWLKSCGARRESEGFEVPEKPCKTTRWREGTLLWSCWSEGKREGMPATANTPLEKAREPRGAAMDVCQVGIGRREPGEVQYGWCDEPSTGLNLLARCFHARHVKKTIGKPCAGKPHARFERGILETDLRKLAPR